MACRNSRYLMPDARSIATRRQELRPRISHRPAKGRRASGEPAPARAGILDYVLVLIQVNYFVVVEDRAVASRFASTAFHSIV